MICAAVIGMATNCSSQPAPRQAEPRLGPTPKPTPKPRPMLKPYGDVFSQPDQEKLNGLLSQVSAFRETYQVGTRTPRVALSGVVLSLQERRRAFEATTVPEGMQATKKWAVDAMNNDIDVLTNWMSRNEGASMVAGAMSDFYWDLFISSFNTDVQAIREKANAAAPAPHQ